MKVLSVILLTFTAITSSEAQFNYSDLFNAQGWGAWSPCFDSDNCTAGLSIRRRECFHTDSALCELLGFELVQQRHCGNSLCKKWNPWTRKPCSVTCGKGEVHISRICMIPGLKEPEPSCFLKLIECNRGICPRRPQAAHWGEWGSWGPCSPCPSGVSTRRRICYNSKNRITYTGNCLNLSTSLPKGLEVRLCDQSLCKPTPVTQIITTTKATTTQTSTSATTTQSSTTKSTTTQTSTTKSATTQTSNSATTTQTSTSATTTQTPTVPTTMVKIERPTWDAWGLWSFCSQSCGPGERKRSRLCLYSNSTKADSNLCGKDAYETENCNTEFCKNWEEWEPISVCPESCRKGENRPIVMQVWRRACGNESEDLEEIQCSAKVRPCASQLACLDDPNSLTSTTTTTTTRHPDTEWQEWSAWSHCSVTCSSGVRTRARSCKYGRDDCKGSSLVSEECKEGPCETTTTEEPEVFWERWTDCSSLCSVGKKSRRKILCPRNSKDNLCFPDYTETEDCNIGFCKNLSNWTSTECSQTCGGGQSNVTRECLEGGNSPKMPQSCFQRMEICNTAPCDEIAQP